jgi:hypothetical protein
MQEIFNLYGWQVSNYEPIHQGLIKVLDPNQKEKFHEVFTNEADQAKALERLTSQGIPIVQQQSANQDNQDQNKDQQKQKNPTTPSSLSSSTGSGPVDGSTGSAGY